MELENNMRSQVLVDALPYIQKYHNKIVVIKYGGNAMTNNELKSAVMKDIVLLRMVGIKVVVVHGGGLEINAMLEKVGKQSKFIGGLRYTDEETIDIVKMVLCGKVNNDLVNALQMHGGKALGLCGCDDQMIVAQKLTGDVDLGYVGDIKKINPDPIINALNNGYVPIISTVGIGEDGHSYNINADTAASRIAACLHAENFVLMTNTVGLLEDKDDSSTRIPTVNVSEVPHLKNKGIISGGMIPKIDCCVEAIRQGVKKTVIIDGRIPHSILIELLTNEGIGTQFI